MSAARRLWALALLAITPCACQPTMVGLHDHHVEDLWALKRSSPATISRAPEGSPTLILKRFENLSHSPLGGYFVGDRTRAGEMTKIYSTPIDLADPLFESVYEALQGRGYDVWRQYSANTVALPPDPSAHILYLSAAITALEIHIFEVKDNEERRDIAAKCQMSFFEVGERGHQPRFSVDVSVRVSHKDDIIERLAQGVAIEIARQIVLEGTRG